MGARVDGDRVRAYETLAADHSRLRVAAQLERRDDAVLGRCVDLLRPRVEREHVDVPGAVDVSNGREGVGVEHEQSSVSRAADDEQARGVVDQQAVVRLAPGERHPGRDLTRDGIDDGELVTRLDAHEDPPTRRVVLDVPGRSSEWDHRDHPTRASIGDDEGTGRSLVGDVDHPVDGVVGDAVRHSTRAMPCDHAIGAGVDHNELVRGGRRRVQAVQPGDDEHAVHVGEATDRVDDAPSLEIDHDDAAIALMCDVETVSARVDGLVVEPGAAPAERHGRHRAPWHSRRHGDAGDRDDEHTPGEDHEIISATR